MGPDTLEMNEPEELLMNELAGPFPPSGNYTQVLTVMDVFSKYLLTGPLIKFDAQSVSRVLLIIMATHSYMQHLIYEYLKYRCFEL